MQQSVTCGTQHWWERCAWCVWGGAVGAKHCGSKLWHVEHSTHAANDDIFAANDDGYAQKDDMYRHA
eukprot:2941014-Rhodomonas_salina.1